MTHAESPFSFDRYIYCIYLRKKVCRGKGRDLSSQGIRQPFFAFLFSIFLTEKKNNTGTKYKIRATVPVIHWRFTPPTPPFRARRIYLFLRVCGRAAIRRLTRGTKEFPQQKKFFGRWAGRRGEKMIKCVASASRRCDIGALVAMMHVHIPVHRCKYNVRCMNRAAAIDTERTKQIFFT